MSHIRPEGRSPKRRRSACRRGRHDFGEAHHIGGGITRQVCETCSAVTIDLTGSSESATSIVSENKGIISLVTQDSEES